MSPAKDAWLLVESKRGQLEDISLQLVSGSRQLADLVRVSYTSVVSEGIPGKTVESFVSAL